MGRALAAGAAAGFLAFILCASPALAADPAVPSPFTIGTPAVFQDIFETDDLLLLFPYDIEQSPQELTPASELFTYRLMDTDGASVLATATPYAYNNSGYGLGVVSVYFAEADAPAWGGGYIIRIDGNPRYWTAPPSVTHTLSPTEYSAAADQRAALAAFIMAQAAALEIGWGVKLYDTDSSGGTALTSTGQTYFTTTIPGLATVCPAIMAVSSSNPTWPTQETSTAAVDSWVAQWTDTSVEDTLTQWGGTWHVAWNAMSAAILFVLMVACMAFSQMKFGNGDPGLLASGDILIVGTFAGLIYYAVLGLVNIGMGWWMGHHVFWKNV